MDTRVRTTKHDDVAVITIDNPPVNALSPGVPQALRDRLRDTAADPDVTAIVVMGAGSTFPAGADIRELEDVARGRAAPGGPDIHDLLTEIETCPRPVIMALHGTALGGGLELAMAGHYRVAAGNARMGQPEVNLGIIPGAEGSQRLPRLVGVEAALEMCVSGRPVTSADALSQGLVDRIVTDDLQEEAVAFAREQVARGGPHPRTSERLGKLGTKETNAPLYAAARESADRFWRGMSAPLRSIEAIEVAATLRFEEGCRREREIAAECLASDECHALIHAFFAERAVRKVPGLSGQVTPPDISAAAVIGAGAMGSGIAMALANSGIAVKLVDIDQRRVDEGMQKIRQSYERALARGRMSPAEMEARLSRIRPEVGYEGLTGVDLVVEAVFEDLDLKKTIFASLDRSVGEHALLASNTSTLDIDEIAGATSRPGRVLGLHFFNPAHAMRLLEIVRGPRTGDLALATAVEVARKLRKTGVVVGNCRGFVGNRMMLPYMREAQYLVEEGGTPAQVDRALFDFGMAMGIFAVDDMGGLDLQWKVRQEDIRLGLGPDRPLRILPRLCALGRLGQKTGSGWYRYPDGSRTPVPDPEVETLVRTIASEAGIEQRTISDQEIVTRCIYTMVNEGARILEEGHAARASDIDTIYFSGYGFPRWRGGPMWYADTVGLDRVLESCRQLQRVHGQAWEPAALLVRLVEGRQRFQDLDLAAGDSRSSHPR